MKNDQNDHARQGDVEQPIQRSAVVEQTGAKSPPGVGARVLFRKAKTKGNEREPNEITDFPRWKRTGQQRAGDQARKPIITVQARFQPRDRFPAKRSVH